jgi:two-component system response regulator FixJ
MNCHIGDTAGKLADRRRLGGGAAGMQDGHDGAVAVVDDDDAVRDSLQFLLEIAGFQVDAYSSAQQFLNDATLADLRCLVVDQHMPDTTGLQLVTQLRAQGATLPVALITGSPSPDLVRRAQQLGIAAVLEKPLADDVLLNFVAGARP